jgi:hypothetical protein
MISQAMYGIHGNVRSSNTGESLKARIWVMDHDDESSWVESDRISGNFYRYLKEGTYDLIVSSEGYISDTITAVEVIDYEKTALTVQLDSLGTGIRERNYSGLLEIYPNPASDHVSIELNRAAHLPGRIEVYNSLGSLIYTDEWQVGKKKYQMNVTDLNSSFYIIRMLLGEEVWRGSFVVR